jgi:hypothetical protein
VLERLIGLFQAERTDGERADAFFARVALDRVKETLGDLDDMAASDATEADFFDLDEHGKNVPLSIVRATAETHMC